jgi:hypothetical protein
MLFDRTLFLGFAVAVIIGIVLLAFRHPRVSELFVRHIPERPKRRLFLAAISFFLTFSVVRSVAYSIYHHLGPFHDIYIGGRHIHHLVFGILLLLGVGYGWLVDAGAGDDATAHWESRLIALLYGAGAALTLDEFALWLNLEDVYWARQGRASIDAIILFGTLLLASIWGGKFLRALAREFLHLRKREE